MAAKRKNKNTADTRTQKGREEQPLTFSPRSVVAIVILCVFCTRNLQDMSVMVAYNSDRSTLFGNATLEGDESWEEGPDRRATAAPGMSKERAKHTSREIDYIPLEDLVQTSKFDPHMCPNGTFFINSTFANQTLPPRKIPRIVHISGKRPCLTGAFRSSLKNWELEGHSFLFHDDPAVDRLLTKFWPEFPHLQLIQECLISGAAKTDLWRYLVLYEYGGIYSDMDSAPGPRFTTDAAIQPDDDAYIVVEGGGFPAQYFIAASPKHPLMFYAVHRVYLRLFDVNNVLRQRIPVVTGPGALKTAAIDFMKDEKFGYPEEGLYNDTGGRQVRVWGTRATNNEFIVRNAVRSRYKRNGWAAMDQKPYRAIGSQVDEATREWLLQSCRDVLFNISQTRNFQY
eukprot:CAMPEP_0198110242 /NCGR_PEP_ID=MMETSP1442-20131203/2266_1 /TAXON_ID= /ORGANISM="Craspedostauros australis, Strain CCMP3328" /LENGTH=397 /DNA_ID=CAMNT_0043766207 /DNA_START=34 /DNA_END=1227 /DNA_ORIENTATION=-